ncbi:MAG: CHASE2 domain-containing protein [Hyphomicrobiaceae bacterium]
MAALHAPEGQRHVTAVILDDRAAEAIAERYPIGLSEHGRLLRRMLCEGPSVIVVAVSFRYLRDGDAGVEALKNQLRFRVIDGECREVAADEARAGRARSRDGRLVPVTKVFLAATPVSGGHCVPFSPPLGERCDEARKIDGLKEVAEPVVFGRTSLHNSYKLWRPLADGGGLRASPAVHAFEAFCERAGAGLTACARPLPPNDAALVTHWGLYPPPLQARLSEAARYAPPSKPCLGAAGRPPRTAARWWDGARVLRRYVRLNAFGNPDELAIEPHPACRYTSELNAALVAFRAIGDPLVTEALRNRVVVYGTDIAGLGETELVPLHGRLPGALFDAMVIDNLVSYGSSYTREPPKVIEGFSLSWLNVAEFAVSTALLLFASFLIHARPSPSARTGLCDEPRMLPGRALIIYTIVALAVVGFGIFLSVVMLCWPAPNVIAVLGVAALDAGSRWSFAADSVPHRAEIRG